MGNCYPSPNLGSMHTKTVAVHDLHAVGLTGATQLTGGQRAHRQSIHRFTAFSRDTHASPKGKSCTNGVVSSYADVHQPSRCSADDKCDMGAGAMPAVPPSPNETRAGTAPLVSTQVSRDTSTGVTGRSKESISQAQSTASPSEKKSLYVDTGVRKPARPVASKKKYHAYDLFGQWQQMSHDFKEICEEDMGLDWHVSKTTEEAIWDSRLPSHTKAALLRVIARRMELAAAIFELEPFETKTPATAPNQPMSAWQTMSPCNRSAMDH